MIGPAKATVNGTGSLRVGPMKRLLIVEDEPEMAGV